MRSPEKLTLNTEQNAPTSEMASNILPKLTIDKLSDQQQVSIVDFAESFADQASSTENIWSLAAHSDQTNQTLRELANYDRESQRNLTEEMVETNKLFTACLIEKFNQEPDKQKRYNIEKALETGSSAKEHCGSIEDYLELTLLARQNKSEPKNYCENSLYKEMVYQYSFEDKDQNAFSQILTDSNPIKQLQLIPTYLCLTEHSSDDWNRPLLEKINESFKTLRDDPNTSPLIKSEATVAYNMVDDAIDGPGSDLKRFYLSLEKDQQPALRNEFPLADKNFMLTKISPDVVGLLNSNHEIVSLVDRDNKNQEFDNMPEEEALALLNAAHYPGVIAPIQVALHMASSEFYDAPLDSQLQILKFMAISSSDSFEKLCTSFEGQPDQIRKKLLANFVATDFSDDFGDSLLDIVQTERFNNEEKESILDEITSCRESIHGIAKIYNGIEDGEFAKQYSRAANERLTDAITVFREIANGNTAKANLDRFGEASFDYKSAIEALKYEAKSLEIINGTLSDVSTQKKGAYAEYILHPEYNRWRTLYNFYSPDHGYVLIRTRTEGSMSFDPEIEYGSSTNGAEAQISIITDPENPFALPIPFRPDYKNTKDYDISTMNKVSAIRIDREGHAPNAPRNDSKRSPINPIGTVSVDLAALNDRADTPSGKIARLISVGNSIRANKIGSDSKFNHNTKWFNQEKYGTARGFKQLVQSVDSLAAKWCKDTPPKKKEGYTELMRQKNRQIGYKVNKASWSKQSQKHRQIKTLMLK